jgi:lipoate-protein ligase B
VGRRPGENAATPPAAAPPLWHAACGEVVYERALAWQHDLWQRRVDDRVGDVLLTLTHDPVYTAGRHADLERNLVRSDTGVRVVPVERGGDVTYHGPGQLVAYPIVKLASSKAVGGFLDALLAASQATAADHGLPAVCDRRRPGVWVGDDKLAAVGLRVEQGVTFHGLAFNVDCDLGQFQAGIVPCGIRDGGVCSLASLGVSTTLEAERARLVARLAAALDREVVSIAPAALPAPDHAPCAPDRRARRAGSVRGTPAT